MGKEVKWSLFEDDAKLDIETLKLLTIYIPISPNGPQAHDQWETKRYMLMVYLGHDQSLGHLIINLRTVQLLQVGVTKIVIPHDEKTQQELCCYNHHKNLEIKPLTTARDLQFGSSPVSMEER